MRRTTLALYDIFRVSAALGLWLCAGCALETGDDAVSFETDRKAALDRAASDPEFQQKIRALSKDGWSVAALEGATVEHFEAPAASDLERIETRWTRVKLRATRATNSGQLGGELLLAWSHGSVALSWVQPQDDPSSAALGAALAKRDWSGQVADPALEGLEDAPSRQVLASGCTKETATVTDPNTGWRWTSRWRCGNRGGAAMYGDANAWTQTAIMDTTSSWFVCYRRGAGHSGGNNVWYYSLGDRAVSPHQARGAWGYMPAVNVWTSTDPWPGVPACPVPSSPPPRRDGLNKPVIFIHGYSDDGHGYDCNAQYWSAAISDYRSDGNPAFFSGTLGKPLSYGYYNTDRNCDLWSPSPGDREKPIWTLGRELATVLYNRFSRYGDSVDVAAHSMGGLIIRAALTGLQKGEPGFPPYLYVEDVSTLSTPHQGAALGGMCRVLIGTTQCKDMGGLSYLLQEQLYDNPQASGGTDWTLIGFDDDFVVPAWSAVGFRPAMTAQHKIVYPDGQLSGHMGVISRTSGTHTIRYCDHFSLGCNMADVESFITVTGAYDPIRMARYGNYYWHSW
jgi:hypothetical protein